MTAGLHFMRYSDRCIGSGLSNEGEDQTRRGSKAAKRRIRAARLLQQGRKPSEVAKLVGVPRQTGYRWKDMLKTEGIDALRKMSKGGRPALVDAEALGRLQTALTEGPTAHGFGTPFRTLKRMHVLIERQFGVTYCPDTLAELHNRAHQAQVCSTTAFHHGRLLGSG